MELQNSKNSLDSYDIVSGRKSHLTLYMSNVAVIEPEVKQIITHLRPYTMRRRHTAG